MSYCKNKCFGKSHVPVKDTYILDVSLFEKCVEKCKEKEEFKKQFYQKKLCNIKN